MKTYYLFLLFYLIYLIYLFYLSKYLIIYLSLFDILATEIETFTKTQRFIKSRVISTARL